jgi:hypothetical protein
VAQLVAIQVELLLVGLPLRLPPVAHPDVGNLRQFREDDVAALLHLHQVALLGEILQPLVLLPHQIVHVLTLWHSLAPIKRLGLRPAHAGFEFGRSFGGFGVVGVGHFIARFRHEVMIIGKGGSLAAGELADEGLLLGLDLGEAVVLDGEALEFGLLLVEEVVELHHLALPVLSLALPLVALPQRAQLLLLDLHCEVVQALRQRRHRLVHRNHLGNELHRQALQVVRLTELLGVQHADVVLLVEGNRQLLSHPFIFKFDSIQDGHHDQFLKLKLNCGRWWYELAID